LPLACRQQRADGRPFTLHPPEVATRLCLAGAPEHLSAAEYPTSSNVSASAACGSGLAPVSPSQCSLSSATSRSTPRRTEKAALRRRVSGAGDEALTLFAADKLSRLGELRRESAANPGGSATPGPVRESRARRLMHYQRSLALVRNVGPSRLSCGNPTTSSPSSHASALWPGGPADHHPPTRPERSLTGQTGANWGATTRTRDRSSAALMPGTCCHIGDAAGRAEGQLLRIRSALIYRRRRQRPKLRSM
jgi:hypothetical protein